MAFEVNSVLKNFYVIGVSFSNTPISIRELFSINEQKQKALILDAKKHNISNIVTLSTCNRTEIYVDTNNIDLAKSLIVQHSQATIELLHEFGYEYNAEEALDHLYNVGAGLDSQILGDFQIIGQLKDAYRKAEKENSINTLFNRMFSHVFQASKKIKNETELSNGAASVSHAAVQYIKNNTENLDSANILLYGTGEIGKITCENLLSHTNNRKLTIINRNEERAAVLAKKFNITHKPQNLITEELHKADIVIVATGADTPTVYKEHLKEANHKRIFLDLSVPRNIAPEIAKLKNISLVGIDQFSRVSDDVLNIRQKSIPTAKEIITENKTEFCEWLEMQHLSPIFKGVKQGLAMLKEQELAYHRNKLTDEEYAKVDFITGNIINRIAKMSILHIKDVFKTEKGAIDVLEKMFKQHESGTISHHPTKHLHPHAKHLPVNKHTK